MANRTRPNQILFFVSDDEKRIIKGKMKQLGTNNMGAYLRKMAIDGYIIKVDYYNGPLVQTKFQKIIMNQVIPYRSILFPEPTIHVFLAVAALRSRVALTG